jgi:Domain of unknown function (DUF4259)
MCRTRAPFGGSFEQDYRPSLGVWGEGAFDQDAAADWVFEFGEADLASGLNHIQAALMGAARVKPGNYLDSKAAAEAMIAAELVAGICGHGAHFIWGFPASTRSMARTTSPVAHHFVYRLMGSSPAPVLPTSSVHTGVWSSCGRPHTTARAAARAREVDHVQPVAHVPGCD